MTIIKARLNDQALSLSASPVVASGGVEEDVVTFEFDSTWAGYVKKAVFYRDESNVYHVDVGSDNTAVIPWEVLQQAGHMYFGVFGIKGDEIKTSTVVRYRVDPGAITSAAPVQNTAVYAFDQRRTEVANFLDDVIYDPNDYTVSLIADYYTGTGQGKNNPVGADIKISQPGDMMLTDGYSKIGFLQPILAGAQTIYNSTPGATTPFLIISYRKIVQSGLIMPTEALRMIYMPGASNVRDIGGWTCDGGTIRYGKLFRGGQFTDESKSVFVEQLGIRHELNLRGASEAENNPSPVWDGVGYTCPKNYVWYSISDKSTWKEILACVFDCVEDGKPLYFHCSAGADRTGTVACILEAILGVSQSDIDKDYELTTFYSGLTNDNSMRRRNESEWTGLIDAINAYTGDTFRDRVIDFAVSCGISVSKINAFRERMIDGTPDIITARTYTVTNTLDNIDTDNLAISAMENDPYTATLTPKDGFVIRDVKVTMDGEDVTSVVFTGQETDLVYKVTANLTNVSFAGELYAVDGKPYVAKITAYDGCTINALSITMGGIDVSTYYSNGIISIPNVTGDIVITATAVESLTAVNKMVVQESNLNHRISGTSVVSGNGCFVADPIAVDLTKSCPVTFKGFAATMGTLVSNNLNYSNSKVALLDSSNAILAVWYIAASGYNSGWYCPISGDDCVGELSTIFDYAPTAGTMPSASDVAYVQFAPQVGSNALTMDDLTGLEILMNP